MIQWPPGVCDVIGDGHGAAADARQGCRYTLPTTVEREVPQAHWSDSDSSGERIEFCYASQSADDGSKYRTDCPKHVR